MSVWTIRREQDGDEAAIAQVVTTAFAGEEWSDGSEAGIVSRLRDELELEASYVAVTPSGSLVGHVAFSPVTVDGERRGWYGLGPLAVLPDRQRRGGGAAAGGGRRGDGGRRGGPGGGGGGGATG